MSLKKLNVYMIIILLIMIADFILYFNFNFGYDPTATFFTVVAIATLSLIFAFVISILMQNTKIKAILYNIADWGLFISFTILLISNVFMFFIRPAEIEKSSMEPTLHAGDRVFTYIFNYTPTKGDIVPIYIERDNGKTYVKRIAAVENDTLRAERVDVTYYYYLYVNDELYSSEKLLTLDEWITISGQGDTGLADLLYEYTVPERKVLAFGDNYENSQDSKQLGLFDYSDIKGKVFFILFGRNGMQVL